MTTAIHTTADIERLEAQPYAEYMPHRTALEALEASAREYAGRRALTYIPTPDLQVPALSWTYEQLLYKARQAANLFHSLAGGETPRVATLLPNIPQAWFTMLGAETAGVLCPINYQLDADHVAELVTATEANILVVLGPSAELDIWSRVDVVRDRCKGLRQVLVVGGGPSDGVDFDEALAAMPGDRLTTTPSATGDGVAALFHTGGTTGRPKLAQHTQANQLHVSLGAAQMYGMTSQDVMLNGFPLFHVAGSFVCGLSALLVGAELVVPTLLGLRNKVFIERYWDFVERHGVTLLTGVPAIMSTLVANPAPAASLAGVRAMLTGGTPLPDELAVAFLRKFGIPVRNILGMTECAGVISIEPVAGERVRGSCGLRLPYTQVCAVDASGQPLPTGQTGVLQVRGPNVGPGYTETERNAGTFENGWLITGDIGHVEESGYIFITGRAKDLIVRSAHNIDPRMIEDALMGHPSVLMAAAVGEPDEYAGELPVAYVVLKPGEAASVPELLAFSREHVPERPAFPKRIEILEAMPLTAVGKVFKPALRQMAICHAITERVARAGLADRVRVDVRDEGSLTLVVFVVLAGHEAGEQALNDVMAPFALRWRIAQEGT